MTDFDELSQGERFSPTLTVEDGYLKVRIPLGAIALALQQARSEDRIMLLSLEVDEASIADNEIEIIPADVIFASGLCLFSESRKEFMVLDQEVHLSPQELLLMGALAKQLNKPVATETLIAEADQRSLARKSTRTKMRTRVVQNRLSNIRSKAGAVVPDLGDTKTGLIRRVSRSGYMLPREL
jgi:DNA-binding response OmpR family regulator